MNDCEWKYYNHAVLPSLPPKELKDITVPADELFRRYPSAYMIRYTSDFDAYEKSEWWHCVKDTAFDISELKSKQRNVVKNGIKNFDVRVIDLTEYVNEMYEIFTDASRGYDYKIDFSMEQAEQQCRHISRTKTSIVLGAFLKGDTPDNGKLCGYLWLDENGKCVQMIEQKAIRKYERLQINASLVNYACELYNDKISEGYYLYDGERNIVHKTAFQDYLIKYFGFRKAYCKVNVIYNKKVMPFVKTACFFRKPIKWLAKITKKKVLLNITGILLLEDILRWQENEKI